MSSILKIEDLSKRFRSVSVLDHLNLDLPEGSVFSLVGPNGAGKTTTIKILMNILKPTEGNVSVLGVDSRHLGPQNLAQIGYVSENQQLPEWMTVGYFLEYVKAFYPSWDDALANDLLQQFRLPLDRKLRDLSRGMQVKAEILSSLAYHPRLLVLDEPFSGLDPVVREDLISGLLETACETTILLSSHDLAEIESFASHIGYLDSGRLQFSEEMTSLTSRFREIEVTLETPVSVPDNPRWPANWLRPEAAAGLVRFIETRFDSERTSSDIDRLFCDVRQVTVNPMPLRSIFIALARNGSKAV